MPLNCCSLWQNVFPWIPIESPLFRFLLTCPHISQDFPEHPWQNSETLLSLSGPPNLSCIALSYSIAFVIYSIFIGTVIFIFFPCSTYQMHSILLQSNGLKYIKNHLFCSWIWRLTGVSFWVLCQNLPGSDTVTQWLGLKVGLVFPTSEHLNPLELGGPGLLSHPIISICAPPLPGSVKLAKNPLRRLRIPKQVGREVSVPFMILF